MSWSQERRKIAPIWCAETLEKSFRLAAWLSKATQLRPIGENLKCAAECWKSVFTASVTLSILELSMKLLEDVPTSEAQSLVLFVGILTLSCSGDLYLTGKDHPISTRVIETRKANMPNVTMIPSNKVISTKCIRLGLWATRRDMHHWLSRPSLVKNRNTATQE